MIGAPKLKKGKMPFRKGFLHGKNERKLRETFNWEEEEIEKLRGTATSYKHINEIVSEFILATRDD